MTSGHLDSHKLFVKKKIVSAKRVNRAVKNHAMLSKENARLLKAKQKQDQDQVDSPRVPLAAVELCLVSVEAEYVAIRECVEDRYSKTSAKLHELVQSLERTSVCFSKKRKVLNEKERARRRSKSLERVKQYFQAISDLSTIFETSNEKSSGHMQSILGTSGGFSLHTGLPVESPSPRPTSSVSRDDSRPTPGPAGSSLTSDGYIVRLAGISLKANKATIDQEEIGNGAHQENTGKCRNESSGESQLSGCSIWIHKYLDSLQKSGSREAKEANGLCSKAATGEMTRASTSSMKKSRRLEREGDLQNLEKTGSGCNVGGEIVPRAEPSSRARKTNIRALWF